MARKAHKAPKAAKRPVLRRIERFPLDEAGYTGEWVDMDVALPVSLRRRWQTDQTPIAEVLLEKIRAWSFVDTDGAPVPLDRDVLEDYEDIGLYLNKQLWERGLNPLVQWLSEISALRSAENLVAAPSPPASPAPATNGASALTSDSPATPTGSA